MGIVYRKTPPDDGTSRTCGVTVKRNEWPVLMSLAEKPAQVRFLTHFEDAEPMEIKVEVKPGEAKVLSLHEMDQFPDGKLMAFKLTSDQPILPQFSYSEDGIPVPTTQLFMSGAGSRVAHPGPLGKRETKWAYADGHTRKDTDAMADIDWFVVFNPNDRQDADVKIRMSWADAAVENTLRVPAGRVRVFRPGKEAGFKFGRTFGSIFTSNTPVVIEAVRRFAQVKPFVSLNQWTTPAVAIGA
jgi:hypothetical protein